MVTYKKLVYDGDKVQVDSAIRDGNGKQISTNYQRTLSVISGTIPYSAWNSTTKQVTVTVAGLTSSSNVILGPAAADYLAWGTAQIRGISLGTNTITFQCETVPSANIGFELVII